MHNGIDTDTFRPLPGVERIPDKLLYVGNSEDRNKGARFFLKALDLLKDDIDFRVTFVDNFKHNLKLAPKLVDEYGLNSRVTSQAASRRTISSATTTRRSCS